MSRMSLTLMLAACLPCEAPLSAVLTTLAFDTEVGTGETQTFDLTAACGFQKVESSADFTGGWTWSPESWSGFAPGDVQTVAVTYTPTEPSTGDELVLYLESSLDRGSYVILEATGTAF